MADLKELDEQDIAILLRPYLLEGMAVPGNIYGQLAQYLQLLLKWNARTNLTSIRNPGEIVRRHFGESLFVAQHLGDCESLLDFGSGAGFPGLPIQLFRPDLRVTLGESQNKKATFLREVVRTLGLKTEIWGGRVESMPASQRFDIVTLRAVDNMEAAIIAGSLRASKRIMLLTTESQGPRELSGFDIQPGIAIPGTNDQHLLSFDRQP